MKIYKRYIHDPVAADLKSKMAFVGGPRQVGKTTFALSFLSEPSESHPAYLNWDNFSTRKELIRGELPANETFIVLDEIHKFARWRNLVKGFYDTRKSRTAFIITGSARLDYYSKGGDSLQGRYHYFTLHPFSMAEMLGITNIVKPFDEISMYPNNCFKDLEILEHYGGFPEVLIKQNDRTLRRWHHEKLERLFREDVRDL